MPPGRGMSAVNRSKADAVSRKGSGFVQNVWVKEGDKVTGRFRGLFDCAPYPIFTPAQLKKQGAEFRAAYAQILGFALPTTGEKDEIAAFARRYTQVEPFVFVSHQIYGATWPNNSMACSMSWNNEPCPACYLRDDGDKRIGIKDLGIFTFWINAKYHKIEGRSQKDKASYYTCELEEKGVCRWCNGKNDAKWEYPKRFELAIRHVANVVATAENVQKKCASCGGHGKIQHVGWACSSCDGEIAWAYPEVVVNDDGTDARLIICPHCDETMMPFEQVTCSQGCEFPRRTFLHDVDVEIMRTGSKQQTNYVFLPQWPAVALDDQVLGLTMPDWTEVEKPSPMAQRCQILGLADNPFTGEALSTGQTETYDEQQEDVTVDPVSDTDEQAPEVTPDW